MIKVRYKKSLREAWQEIEKSTEDINVLRDDKDTVFTLTYLGDGWIEIEFAPTEDKS